MYKQSLLAAALAAAPALANPQASSHGINVYWGQKGNTQLKEWCDTVPFEYVTIGFINNSPENDPSALHYPGSNFGAHCSAYVYKDATDKPSLLNSNCNFIAEDIPYCQSKGKKVLLSIGGAAGNYDVTGQTEGEYFAEFMFNAYGPYNSAKPEPRPFDYTENGEVVHVSVDGFDFDIEHKPKDQSKGYIAMVNKLNELIGGCEKELLVTAAPECPLNPDYFKMKDIIDGAKFDILFIQFYNNPDCQGGSPNFNFNGWVDYLEDKPSKGAKIFLGLPGDDTPASAGSGYLSGETACSIVKDLKQSPSFGGVMLWDIVTSSGHKVGDVSYLQYLHDCVVGSGSNPGGSTTTTATTASSTDTASATTTASTTDNASATTTASTTDNASATTTASTTDNASATTTASTTDNASVTTTASTTDIASATTDTASATTTATTTDDDDDYCWEEPTDTATTDTATATTTGSTTATTTDSTTATTTDSTAAATTDPTTAATTDPTTAATTDPTTAATDSTTATTTSTTATTSATATDDDYCWEEPTDSATDTTATNTATATDSTTTSAIATGSTTSSVTSSWTTTTPSNTATITDTLSITSWPSVSVTYVTLTTSTIFTTTCETVTSCAPGGNCGVEVVTRTVAVSTTVCPVTLTEATWKPTATASWPAGWTTSTIYSTKTYTITSCAPTVTNCPAHFPHVTTEVVPVGTTICPVEAGTWPKPTGTDKPIVIPTWQPEGDWTSRTKITNTQFTTFTVPKQDWPAPSGGAPKPDWSAPNGGAGGAAPSWSKPGAGSGSGSGAAWPSGAASPSWSKPAGTATGALPVATAGAARNSVALGLTGILAVVFFAL